MCVCVCVYVRARWRLGVFKDVHKVIPEAPKTKKLSPWQQDQDVNGKVFWMHTGTLLRRWSLLHVSR